MQRIGTSSLLLLALFTWAGCSSQGNNSSETSSDASETTPEAASVVVSAPVDQDEGLAIRSQDYVPRILLDAGGDIASTLVIRTLLGNKEPIIETHFQRVGCSSDTCRQESVTFAAVEYPLDSLLQQWMADVLSHYYYDVTRELDIRVNGEKTQENGDGEMETLNRGCSPYQGIIGDGGREMFDYYQRRLWLIGRDRPADQHGPSGRYGCAIYRCWQSPKVASYFVAYSTEEPQRPVHYAVSFDRRTGRQLELTDVIRDDQLAELNDLLVDAARGRHYQLRRRNPDDLAIEAGDCDYSSDIQPTSVAFLEEGVAFSTGALPFDQWANATHILVIPYEKVRHLLVDQYSR